MSDPQHNAPEPDDSEEPARDPADPFLLALPAHYTIEAEIGRGGMGTVVRALDRKHGRRVAIKILRPELAQTFGTERFLREIHTAAQLVHPHIVTVFDSGEANGTLYFVMPYVEGESLRERMEREGPLPVHEAVRIIREIAGALQYAHELGIVHRDIKPENILLSKNGHAWLADFGVARAAAAGANARLTQTGLILGSPLYLSPEQTRDDKHIDHRSDLYSLACVLYEMLAGAPAFGGSSVQAVLMKHLTETPPSLRTRRAEVPPALDQVLQKAMAKVPADRYQSAGELERAVTRSLEGVGTPEGRTTARRRALRRMGTVAKWVGGAAVPVIIGITIDALSESFSLPDVGSMIANRGSLDTTRYVVLPFAVGPGVPDLDPESRLRDAISAYSGVDVIEVRDTTDAAGSDVRRVGRKFKAGRIIKAEVTRKEDSLRVFAQVWDGNDPRVRLAQSRRVFAINPASFDVQFRAIADSLLLPGVAPECVATRTGTQSLQAIFSCDRAFSALQDGDLSLADTAFDEALRIDPRYGRAALWLAQLRGWIVDPPRDDQTLVRIAIADSADLSARERTLANASMDLTSGRYLEACGKYQQLTAADSLDVAAWLGLGECIRRDSVVLRNSTGGWRFRSSYHRAIRAYARAFEVQPSLLAGYRSRSFLPIREVFITSTTTIRTGRALPPDTTTFLAYPFLHGDTLTFTPMPAAVFSAVTADVAAASLQAAVDRQRDLVRSLAERWVARLPNSSAAGEALAVAHELGGNRLAVQTIEEARTRARSESERIALAVSAVWLRLKFALPDRLNEVKIAAALADSILKHATPKSLEQLHAFAALSVLLGQPTRGASFVRQTASAAAQALRLPAGVIEHARALLVFAAAGAPADSLREVEKEFHRALQNLVSPDQQKQVQVRLLTQAAMLAFPTYELSSFSSLAPTGVYTSAEQAYAQRDTQRVRSILDRLRAARQGMRDADITIDGIYIEAWLLDRTGDPRGAIQRLDPVLGSIQWFPPGRIDELARTGSLIRAMALRADLAARQNDHSAAKRWAAPLAILWSNAESGFPLADHVRQLARN